jgi:tetratricopeptide (TPR) repeat protein
MILQKRTPSPFRRTLWGPAFILACLTLLFSLALLGGWPGAAAGAEEPLSYYVQLKGELKAAQQTGDKQVLLKLREAIKTRLQQESSPDAYLTYYYAAYLDDRIVYLLRLKKEGGAPHKYLDEGIAYLETAIKLKKDFTEGYILLASLYGQKAADEMVASFFGPKSTYMVTKALKMEPENPRAHLIDGIGKFFAPKAFGGDPEKALQALEKAEKCFPNYQSPNAAYPDWGYVETYAWLAQVRRARRDYSGARKALQAGLAMDPENLWLKTLAAQMDDQEKTESKQDN